MGKSRRWGVERPAAASAVRVQGHLVDLELTVAPEHLLRGHTPMGLLEGLALGPGPEVLLALPEGQDDEVLALDRAEHQIPDEAGLPVHQTATSPEAVEEVLLVALGDGDSVLDNDHLGLLPRPAGDLEDLAGHELGGGSHEEEDGPDHVGRPAGVAHRDPTPQHLVGGARLLVPGLVLEQAGGDHVDGDAPAGLLQGEGLGECDDPGLGR
jgi:hypothetical protein